MNHKDASTVKIDAMSSEDPQIKIRLAPELKAAVEAAAAQNERTMTAEIAARLRATFDLEDVVKSGYGRPLGLTEAEIVRLIDKRIKIASKVASTAPKR